MSQQDRNAVKVAIDKLGYDFDHFELNDFIRHVERVLRREIILLPFAFLKKSSASTVWLF